MSIHKLIDSFDIWFSDPDTRYRLEIFRESGGDGLFGYFVFSFHLDKTTDGVPYSAARRIFNGCQIDSYDSVMNVAKDNIQKWHDQLSEKAK